MIEILEPDFFFADDRGTLTQIVREGYRQVNAVFTKKGAVRGTWHYHKDHDEACYVIAGRLRVAAACGDAREEQTFTGGDMFLIPANVKHYFTYLEDTYLVVLYTDCVEHADGTKDIYND